MTITQHGILPLVMSDYSSLWSEIELACETLYYGNYKNWTGLERVLSPCNRESQKSYSGIPVPFDSPRSDQEIVENKVFAIEYQRIKTSGQNSQVDIKRIGDNTPSIMAAKRAMDRRKVGENFCLENLYQGNAPAFLWNELTGELIGLPKEIWSTPQGEKASISHAPGLWSGETGTTLGVVESMPVLIKSNALGNAAFKHLQETAKTHKQANEIMKSVRDRKGNQDNQSSAIGYRKVIEILYRNAPSCINDDRWGHCDFIHDKGKSEEWETTALMGQKRISMITGDWNQWENSDFGRASGEATNKNGTVYRKLTWNRNEIERDRCEFHEIIQRQNSILNASLLERIEVWNKNKEAFVEAVDEPQMESAEFVKPGNDPEQVAGKVAMACDSARKQVGRKYRQKEIIAIIKEQYPDVNSLPSTPEISQRVVSVWLGNGNDKEPNRKTISEAVRVVRSVLADSR